MRPSIQHVLDGLTGAAAFVHNPRLDNLAANQLGRALYSDMFSRATGPGPVNSARYVFLDPGARDFLRVPRVQQIDASVCPRRCQNVR